MTVNTELPIDIETMRATTGRLLADDAEALLGDDLETLSGQLRGHIELIVPEVEQAALTLPRYWPPREQALVSVWVARRNLSAAPSSGHSAHVRELARILRTLCDRHAAVGGGDGHGTVPA